MQGVLWFRGKCSKQSPCVFFDTRYSDSALPLTCISVKPLLLPVFCEYCLPEKRFMVAWPGNSVGSSVIPIRHDCGFDPGESTYKKQPNECISKWNYQSMFLSQVSTFKKRERDIQGNWQVGIFLQLSTKTAVEPFSGLVRWCFLALWISAAQPPWRLHMIANVAQP